MICKQVYKHNSMGMSKHPHINCDANLQKINKN
jgi:hypothetical protein